MILEKFGKKKYQIWSFNQVEKLITDFNSGLKRKDELCNCASSTWTTIGQINLNANMYHNRTDAPVVTSARQGYFFIFILFFSAVDQVKKGRSWA